ncbi:subtilase-type protease inhibitor [Streptomyces sp. HPF1205]|uniref:subtilase-type protease inhibitor n=1 Tax=Streptomyces sp. HPF1205 TaxID=2873262 RepID=UPI001CECF378|nr:subtilase-type protease inhibitor [Streptomyces sp. HPF1205]
MRKRLGLLFAAGMAAAVASATALPAVASPSDTTAPLTSLLITKSHLIATSRTAAASQVTLDCEPTGGTHPTAQAACDALIAVNGDFAKLPPATGVFCLAVWDPVTVSVTGVWRQKPVTFTRTYSNDCDAAVSSDNVFRF